MPWWGIVLLVLLGVVIGAVAVIVRVVKSFRWMGCFLVVLTLAASGAAFGADPSAPVSYPATTTDGPASECARRPAWCQPGYVCTPTRCAADTAVQLHLLAAETEALRKRRAKRWSCVVGAGAGVYMQVAGGEVDFDAAPLPGALVCGWVF